MYGLTQLKPVLTVTDSEVSCPVLGCPKMVKRQRKSFACHPEFLCEDHGILISPSTFQNTAFAPGTDYAQIAEQEQKYELMRFWLLGTWMANQPPKVDFRLVNLLRDQAKEERDIEIRFRKHLPEPLKTKFQRETWESVHRFIQDRAPHSADKDTVLNYFKEKTVGYRNGLLQKAFAV